MKDEIHIRKICIKNKIDKYEEECREYKNKIVQLENKRVPLEKIQNSILEQKQNAHLDLQRSINDYENHKNILANVEKKIEKIWNKEKKVVDRNKKIDDKEDIENKLENLLYNDKNQLLLNAFKNLLKYNHIDDNLQNFLIENNITILYDAKSNLTPMFTGTKNKDDNIEFAIQLLFRLANYKNVSNNEKINMFVRIY